MTLYVDQYILINLCINFTILHITSKIIKSKVKTTTILLVSLCSSVISLLLLKISVPTFLILFLPILMILITFKPKSGLLIAKHTAIFYSIAFLTGGLGCALLNTFYKNGYPQTLKVIFIAITMSYIAVNIVSDFYEKRVKTDSLSHKVEISLNEKSVKFDAYYDTGNNLKEPVSGLPVIVTNIKSVKTLLPESFVYEFSHNPCISEMFIHHNSNIKLKFVPFHTIAESGLMLCFVPDKITVDETEVNALIGISKSNISHDHSYNAILNPQIIC